MLEFLADQNLNDDIISSLRRRVPTVNIVRVRELDLDQADDPTIIEQAADMGRIVLTHDRRMTRFVYFRVESGLPMPGVFVVSQQPGDLSVLLDNLQLYTEQSLPGEWEGQVRWITGLPLPE